MPEKSRIFRPSQVYLLQIRARAIRFRLTFQEPTALTTALALRQGIWRKEDPRWHVCGIPSTFYTDHGPDFTSKHLEQVAIDLHLECEAVMLHGQKAR